MYKDGNISLEDINGNNQQIKYADNSLMLNVDNKRRLFEKVEIKGHGNRSWEMEKKSYRIKFNEKVDLLGMGKAKKWVLIANILDDSLLRNDLGFFLNRMIVDDSPMFGDYVELYVNGEELGLYYATKSIDIDKKMFPLKDPFGVIVEYDNAYGEDEEIKYKTKDNGVLTVKDAVYDSNAEKALELFGSDFDKFEELAESHDYEAIEEIIDVESFANYFLLSEISGNPDAYLTSMYFYKDGVDDKIHAGIGWDFDGAFGNKNWDDWDPGKLMAKRKLAFSKDTLVSRFYYYLIEIPEFQILVSDIYRAKIYGRTDDIVAYIDMRAERIEEKAILDNYKWEKGDFWEDVDWLKWWVKERLRIYDSVYGGDVLLPVKNCET